jgi:hypothetical protein
MMLHSYKRAKLCFSFFCIAMPLSLFLKNFGGSIYFVDDGWNE